MANNLNPQQFGEYVPSATVEAQGHVAGHTGGSDQSIVPDGNFGKKVPKKLNRVPVENWAKIAGKLGYGAPN